MKEVIVSGMRPTGALHLGHFVGVLKNWVTLQETHQCYFFLADWHAVTSNYESMETIRKSRYENVRGWLACGIDPDRSPIYRQSDIPEVLYLNQLFLCLTPPGWADRSPSWKDLATNPNRVLDNLGFYTYPILQSADIAILKGKWVPVGEDQVTHVEISREIIRKFNRTYKTNLPEPEAKLTAVPKLLGLNGEKMSSSKGNVITLQETEKSLQNKINKMKTDDQRKGIEYPGNPDNCSVYDYHKIFSPKELVEEVNHGCRGAKLGCGDCKQKLGGCMKSELMPIAEKMAKISDKYCDEVLDHGRSVVAPLAKAHWEELRGKVGF